MPLLNPILPEQSFIPYSTSEYFSFDTNAESDLDLLFFDFTSKGINEFDVRTKKSCSNVPLSFL